MNALDILRSDHARLRQILPRLRDDAVAPDERKRLLGTIEREIKMHTRVEEEIFYPAWKDASNTRDERDMYFESIEEHHVVDMLLPELMPLDPTSDGFRAKAKVLQELIEHHAGEEEEDMFPKAQQLLGTARLDELGAAITERKNELDAQWSTTLGSVMHKVQGVAEKFAPTSAKDARVDAHRESRKE